MICICGVCIPYSVLWPFILILLKPLYEFLFGKQPQKVAESKSSCCGPSGVCQDKDSTITSTNGQVIDIKTEQEYYEYIQSSNLTVVKHSADWCAPCKKIADFYHELSMTYPFTNFITIDVDSFDQISAANGAIKIPYFVIFHRGQTIKSLGSSDQKILKEFVDTAVSDSKSIRDDATSK